MMGAPQDPSGCTLAWCDSALLGGQARREAEHEEEVILGGMKTARGVRASQGSGARLG